MNRTKWIQKLAIALAVIVFLPLIVVGMAAAVSRMLPGGRARALTHWHPSHFEIYDTVCRMGKRGNVMVLRCGIAGGAMLYAGAGEDCPYAPGKKYPLGRYYYLEAA